MWGRHGARAGARLPPPALLSLGSSKQKPLAPGSPCPTVLTNALNVVAKAPAVPPPPLLPRNNQVSRLIGAAGCAGIQSSFYPGTFPPGSQAAPTPPSASTLCPPVASAQAPSITPRPTSACFVFQVGLCCCAHQSWWAGMDWSPKHPHPAE